MRTDARRQPLRTAGNPPGVVTPKKKLGQHFLRDVQIARRIADTVDFCPGLPMLEVGPGTGVLTSFLSEKGREFKAVEIDRESVAYLEKNFPSLDIVNGDFLKLDLEDVFGGRPFVLTGNYPYDISTQIFFHMLVYRDFVPCCTGMVQREVALRIASPPGNKAYGILSVLIQAWYDTEYLFTVDEDAFYPPPRVKSAVIRMTRNSVTSLGCDERLFRRVVKTTFNQRRKMLRSSVKPLFQNGVLPPPEFFDREIFSRRPEELSVRDFAELTNIIAREAGGPAGK